MRRRARPTALLPLLLGLTVAGCQFQWDDLGGDLPTVGSPLPKSAMQKLNSGPASNSTFVYDRSERPYIVFNEAVETDQGPGLALRVQRLVGEALDYYVLASEAYISTYAFFVLTKEDAGGGPDNAATRLNVLEVGELDGARNFLVPNGPALLFPSDDDRVMFYIVQDADVTEYDLLRLDGSFRRKIPLPSGVEPIDPLAGMTFFFTGEGDAQRLVLRDADKNVTLYSTTAVQDVALGKMAGVIWSQASLERIFVCGADGLFAMSFDGQTKTLYDARPCATDFTQLGITDEHIYYGVEQKLYRIPVAPGGTPELLDPSPRRLLHITLDGEGGEHILTSSDPSSRYSNGAGTGFVGSWQFMERGRAARYKRDLSRVFWIEHAALPSGAGDLLTATVPGGTPLRLLRNVRKYTELDDGRLLATANVAFRGVHNRVVLVDTERREQRWVAEAATDFARIPGTNDIILELVASPESTDIYRATLPAPTVDGGAP